jgi:hypothetical protein
MIHFSASAREIKILKHLRRDAFCDRVQLKFYGALKKWRGAQLLQR